MRPATIVLRDATPEDRAWAARVYAAVDFAPTADDDLQLVALRDDLAIGLGRLVSVGDGAYELGGIWTAETARGQGVAAAMVRALLERAGPTSDVWCVPFDTLADYYAGFGFAIAAPPWPPGVARKVEHCSARRQDVVVMHR